MNNQNIKMHCQLGIYFYYQCTVLDDVGKRIRKLVLEKHMFHNWKKIRINVKFWWTLKNEYDVETFLVST